MFTDLNVEEKIYLHETSKANINISKLFEEDKDILADPVQRAHVDGSSYAKRYKKLLDEIRAADERYLPYDKHKIFTRFLRLRRQYCPNDTMRVVGDDASPKEKPLSEDDKSGIQLWGIGYESSDDENYASDGDNSEEELDEDEIASISVLSSKIEKIETELDETDMQQIKDSSALRDNFNNRWWNPSLTDSFFTVYANDHRMKGKEPYVKFRKGDQIFNNYGDHTNSFLIEK
jgi:hypothetical protein